MEEEEQIGKGNMNKLGRGEGERRVRNGREE